MVTVIAFLEPSVADYPANFDVLKLVSAGASFQVIPEGS
tara:strand:+ start:776 stop:892 length:117 start_codon:yes stop_codon:yes gene_type:complete